MDERTMRLQCLQHANQLLGMNYPGQEAKHTPDEVMALAERLFQWVANGQKS